eukprot:gene7814-8011_t
MQLVASLLPLVLLSVCSLAVASAHNHHSHASHGAARRLLTNKSNKNGSGQESVIGNRPSWHSGKKFDFSDESGGAKGYLRRLRNKNKAKHDRLLANSGWNNKKIDEIANELDQDHDLGIDEDNDNFIYACAGLNFDVAAEAAGIVQAAAAPGEFLNGAGPTDADPAIANVWNLTSRPGATKKIWLDFRGGTVSNRAWNSGANITWPPFDSNSNPSSFSTVELGQIVAIWRAVSEDYSPFLVDVTTVDQVAINASNTTYLRVAIGGKSQSVLSPTLAAGGIAYVGQFGKDAKYQPAFVFPGNLNANGASGPKNIWEAISHEVGHTMGLQHDGRKINSSYTEAYYSGANGWAPTMGVGYYHSLTQWSKGDYVNASNTQDDLAVIASKLNYVPPGNGNRTATATALIPVINGTLATVSEIGIISTTNTSDVFKIDANPGTLTVNVSTVTPYSTYSRSNLDVAVQVQDAAGNPVGQVLDSPGLAVSGIVTLPATGAYYIAVSGVGSSAKYSSYGSLGQFALTATFQAPLAKAPGAGRR